MSRNLASLAARSKRSIYGTPGTLEVVSLYHYGPMGILRAWAHGVSTPVARPNRK